MEEKVNIELITLGSVNHDFNKKRLLNWDSQLFSLRNPINHYSLNAESDLNDWGFSDKTLSERVPDLSPGMDFLIAISGIALEDNFYLRPLPNNRFIFSFHEIGDVLEGKNIPLENSILRMFYATTLVFFEYGRRIPLIEEMPNISHSETKGCIFDMNGFKFDLVHSCHDPIICDDCIHRLTNGRISEQDISIARKEIKQIKKNRFYIISDFIKRHPIWSLVITGVTATALSFLGSFLANLYFYQN